MAIEKVTVLKDSVPGKRTENECNVDSSIKTRIHPKSHHKVPMQGAALFKGVFNPGGLPIAAKRYTLDKTDEYHDSNPTVVSDYTSCILRAKNNLEFLSLPGNKHPNLIKYYGYGITDTDFYLFTELCEYSVYNLFLDSDVSEKDRNTVLQALPHKMILKQSTAAVNFLHGLGLVHRGLHPNNFLIQSSGNYKFIIKLTDFQLAKDWEKEGKESGKHKMKGWWAVPECPIKIHCSSDGDADLATEPIEPPKRDSKSDVYTLGCYFYFVLSEGGHPFKDAGDPSIYELSSKPYEKTWIPNDQNWIKARDVGEEEAGKALNLIRKMIKFQPSERISMWQVLDSDYFQLEPSHYELYEDSNKTPGLCVVISQEKFHYPESDIDGIENDCAQLRRTFLRFGYEVVVYQNLEANEIIDRLEPNNLAKDSSKDLADYASLVVCILSHGDKGVVDGVDGLSVNIDSVRRKFNNYDCKELTGKPKIFIILACQGNGSQIVYSHPPAANNLPRDVFTIEDTKDTKSAMEDFLTLKSTVDDFYSYFIPGVGSQFIEHLCGALVSEYNEKGIQSSQEKITKKSLVKLFQSYVLAAICREEICIGNATVRQTPELRSSLTKTIRFRPQVATSEIAALITSEREGLFVKYNGMGQLKFWEKREKGVKQCIRLLEARIKKLESDLRNLQPNEFKCLIIQIELKKKRKMLDDLNLKEREVLEKIETMRNTSGDSANNWKYWSCVFL